MADERLVRLLRDLSLRRGSFGLASGQRSHVYVDVRTAALHEEAGYVIADALLRILDEKIHAVGGVVLGAAPLVSSVVTLGHVRNRPLHGLLIRKQTKGHGTAELVEGIRNLEAPEIAVIDDTVTTGSSLLQGIELVTQLGLKVVQVIAVVDREQGASELLANRGFRLESLVHLSELLRED